MEKEKLHRFFAGTTSIQEGMDIRAWMEASEENKRIFYKAVSYTHLTLPTNSRV